MKVFFLPSNSHGSSAHICFYWTLCTLISFESRDHQCFLLSHCSFILFVTFVSLQASKTPEVNFTWNFAPLSPCAEYNVFNTMFWALLKCVSPTIWLNLCECVYLLPRSPTPPSRLSLPSECMAPPPWYLCHYSTQECVFLFVAIPTWHAARRRICVRVFKMCVLSQVQLGQRAERNKDAVWWNAKLTDKEKNQDANTCLFLLFLQFSVQMSIRKEKLEPCFWDLTETKLWIWSCRDLGIQVFSRDRKWNKKRQTLVWMFKMMCAYLDDELSFTFHKKCILDFNLIV